MKKYRTCNLYLAAFLKAKGYCLVDKEQEGNKSFFVFKDQTDRPQVVNSYFNDGEVKVLYFKNALRDLKTILHN